jgi:release factor glutamine methyltransferase
MTIKELLAFVNKSISTIYDSDEAGQIASWLLEERLNKSRIQLLTQAEEHVDESLINQIKNDTEALLSFKPIQQILGFAYFYESKILVNEHTLIPRPETEELVDLIINNNKTKTLLKILDIGTGSGCIPISLKKHFKDAQVVALDISTDALSIAKKSAILNNVQIEFVEADILSDKSSLSISDFDIIVSNPPYIKLDEKEQMKNNVLLHEPHLALFVYDEDALLFYRKIIDFAIKNNTKSFQIYFEINEELGKDVIELLTQKGFEESTIHKDLQGKDRMVSASYLIH